MKEENGKRYIDFKWFLTFLLTITVIFGSLAMFSFYSRADGKQLEERVNNVVNRQTAIEEKLDKMNDKLDKLLIRGVK